MSAILKETTLARITFSDMPPSTNGLRSSFVRNGKVVSAKSATYAAWRKAATWEIVSQKTGCVTGPYVLHVAVQRNWRTKRARDIDNIIKPISDAIVSAGIVKDDSLAERVSAQWADDLGGAAVVALVQPYTLEWTEREARAA